MSLLLLLVLALLLALSLPAAIAVSGVAASAATVAGTGVGITTITIAIFGAFAFVTPIAFISALAGSRISTGEKAYLIAFMLVTSGLFLLFAAYIASRARHEDPQFLSQCRFGVMLAAFGGTHFIGANLSGAIFTSAQLKNTRLAGAILERIVFRDAKGLKEAHTGKTILREPKIRELLVTGQGANNDYSHADLHGAYLDKADLRKAKLNFADLSGASLRGADLSNADLSQAQCVGADFSGAILTGACLEAWNIDSTTVLQDARADYVYLLKNQQERRPASGKFAPGEFTKFFQEVLDTVDLIFREGMDWKAFLISLHNLKVAVGDSEITVQSIENKGDNTFVVRLKVPPEIDKAAIHEQFRQDYEHQLALLETRYKAELAGKDEVINKLIGEHRYASSNLMQIIRYQAEQPLTTIITEQNTMSIFDQRGQKVDTQHNVAGDNIDFAGASITGSNLNIKSTLTNVTQTIGALPNTGAEEKARLEELLKQLAEALQQVPPKEAERITTLLDRTLEDAKSGDKSMFQIGAEGLQKATEAVASVVPRVGEVVQQMLALLGA